MMKPNQCKAIRMLLFFFMLANTVQAQDIQGDTIHVDATNVVAIKFPVSPGKAELISTTGQEGLYEVKDMGEKSIAIRALKKDVADQFLEVSEGERKHLLILSYKEGSPARSIDWSTKKKLSNRIEEMKKQVVEALRAANSVYDRAKDPASNAKMWEEVEANYARLLNLVAPQDRKLVNTRLLESGQKIKEKKYDAAMITGRTHLYSGKFREARKAFVEAVGHKPGDDSALNKIRITDSTWANYYVDKGDEASTLKKYIEAKENYKEALAIKRDYPSLQKKFDEVRVMADPLIYNFQISKGDQALSQGDLVEAKSGYDSALSVKPADSYVKSQLNEIKIELEYQRLLASAKNLAYSASDAAGYDLAIKEYRQALGLFRTRKFPLKKISELAKLRKLVKAN